MMILICFGSNVLYCFTLTYIMTKIRWNIVWMLQKERFSGIETLITGFPITLFQVHEQIWVQMLIGLAKTTRYLHTII